jgi:hypothetical protein
MLKKVIGILGLLVLVISCTPPAPEAPKLTATPLAFSARLSLEEGQLVINWNSLPQATGYRVFRLDANGDRTLLNAQPVNSTSYTDTSFFTLTENWNYHYTVQYLDNSQIWSADSLPSLSISPRVSGCKTTPFTDKTKIRLNWQIHAIADNYVIYRGSSVQNFVKIGETTADYWEDTKALSNTVYFYQVGWEKDGQEYGLANASPVCGIYDDQQLDYYEPNDDWSLLQQEATSQFAAGQPPCFFYCHDGSNVWSDSDFYKYRGNAVGIIVTVSLPTGTSFTDGELQFQFYYNSLPVAGPQAIHKGIPNTFIFDNYGSSFGPEDEVDVYFCITHKSEPGRLVWGTYQITLD